MRAHLTLLLIAAAFVIPTPTAAESPVGCDVAPRTVREVALLTQRNGTPAPTATPDPHPSPTPADTPTPTPDIPRTPLPTPQDGPSGPGVLDEITLPEGPPASPEEIAAMSAVMTSFAACTNAGEVLRMMALVSDAYVAGSFAGAALTEEQVTTFIGTPHEIALDEQRTFAGLRDARDLGNGYWGALVDMAAVGGPVPGKIRTDYVFFTVEGGAWKIAAYTAGLPAEQFAPEVYQAE